MSSMMPQGEGPDIQAMLAQLGGGGQGGPPPGPPPGDAGGDWLVAAINAVHEGMVQESDPQIVSMLGAIINNLTSVQAKLLPSAAGKSGA